MTHNTDTAHITDEHGSLCRRFDTSGRWVKPNEREGVHYNICKACEKANDKETKRREERDHQVKADREIVGDDHHRLARLANAYLDAIDEKDDSPSIRLTRSERAIAVAEFLQFALGFEIYVNEPKNGPATLS
jgi:hypothetical protein